MIVLRGMYGIGDCIHQRAVVREVMRAGVPVTLETFYRAMHLDLVDEGLRLKLIGGVKPRVRERDPLLPSASDVLPRGKNVHAKITYNAASIHAHGSILAAQFASAGFRMPERPDFHLRVPAEWRAWGRTAARSDGSKPLLVYRPIVLNNVWRAEARAPDPALYSALFRALRDRYHVVSVANLGQAGESIVGEKQDADVSYNRGELDFETLVGLFAEADMTFTCPGFAPVLSQAVGTKCVIVYGANERHSTTNVVGEHLAPTLAIEPTVPCSHHTKTCGCDKTFALAPAHDRLMEFAA